MLNYVRHFFKIVFHMLYLWNEVSDPQFFFAFLTQVTHYLTAVKILKKSVDWRMRWCPSTMTLSFCFYIISKQSNKMLLFLQKDGSVNTSCCFSCRDAHNRTSCWVVCRSWKILESVLSLHLSQQKLYTVITLTLT